MGELTDKIKGNVDEAVGKAKQAIGGHQGDADLHDEGAIACGLGHAAALHDMKSALAEEERVRPERRFQLRDRGVLGCDGHGIVHLVQHVAHLRIGQSHAGAP